MLQPASMRPALARPQRGRLQYFVVSPNSHEHLRRLSRVWIKEPIYFITTCTHNRLPVLAQPEATDILRTEWHQALDRHGWAIGRYVIMPDHVHFFGKPAVEAKPLSEFMNRWKEWTSKGLAKRFTITPPIWQPEFFDHILRSSESYSEKWLYVQNNPVRAGLCPDAEKWPYQGFIHFP
jgi:putative transposase